MSNTYLKLREELDSYGVQLIAVSKTFDFNRIESIYRMGQRDFGENYAQEFLIKAKRNENEDLRWHFLGRLQSNKTRVVSQYADCCHSLDRIEIAHKINAVRPNFRADPLRVCLQINLSDERQKGGCVDVDSLFELAEQVSKLENLKLNGLMLLPSNIEIYGVEEIKSQFILARKIYEQLQKLYVDVGVLSMGMSSDYRLAIDCGSNCVRIGSLIFGDR